MHNRGWNRDIHLPYLPYVLIADPNQSRKWRNFVVNFKALAAELFLFTRGGWVFDGINGRGRDDPKKVWRTVGAMQNDS